jgi:nitrite reductase/ring-hydroxylating ferredoxin subunit
VKGEKMGLFKRILGLCATNPPRDAHCWSYSQGRLEVDPERCPELTKPDGAIRLEGKGLPERVLLLHGNDDRFYAFKNRCTHMGRRLDPLAGKPAVRCCSVSKSTFDYEGEKVSGPAKGPLTPYKVFAEEGKLVISVI